MKSFRPKDEDDGEGGMAIAGPIPKGRSGARRRTSPRTVGTVRNSVCEADGLKMGSKKERALRTGTKKSKSCWIS